MQNAYSRSSRRASILRLAGFLSVAALITLMTLSPAQHASAADSEIEGVVTARQQSAAGEMVLIDIRRPEEWQESGVPDTAIALDMTAKDFLPRLQEVIEQNPDKRLGLICAVGSRSRYLADWLNRQGVKNVVNVSAGVHGRNGWLANKLPVRKPDGS
ncbi:MAG: rhodanese-like domain-containing protein [Burkholderiaceae bacterium]